jgi:hypothetical protein
MARYDYMRTGRSWYPRFKYRRCQDRTKDSASIRSAVVGLRVFSNRLRSQNGKLASKVCAIRQVGDLPTRTCKRETIVVSRSAVAKVKQAWLVSASVIRSIGVLIRFSDSCAMPSYRRETIFSKYLLTMHYELCLVYFPLPM